MITHCEHWILQDKCPWYPTIKMGSILCYKCPYFKDRVPFLGLAKNGQVIKVKCGKENELHGKEKAK